MIGTATQVRSTAWLFFLLDQRKSKMQNSKDKKKTKLTLSRKDGESIALGDDVTITVHRRGNRTRVTVEADASLRIMRSELLAAS